jgi:hypothetical protein
MKGQNDTKWHGKKRCSQPAAKSELEVDRNYKNVYRQKPKANTKYALQYRQNAVPYNVI